MDFRAQGRVIAAVCAAIPKLIERPSSSSSGSKLAILSDGEALAWDKKLGEQQTIWKRFVGDPINFERGLALAHQEASMGNDDPEASVWRFMMLADVATTDDQIMAIGEAAVDCGAFNDFLDDKLSKKQVRK